MKRLLVLFLCFTLVDLAAQDNYDATGVSFNLNSSFDLNTKYSLKPAVKGRYLSLFNKSENLEDINDKSQRVDLQLALERRLKSTTKIAAGAFYRLSDTQNATRLFQQIGWIKGTHSNVTLIYRIKADQTFRENDPIELRARYRFGISLPLQGFNLNKSEKYLLAYTEYLGKYRTDFANEFRLKLSLGLLMNGGSKAEVGIDFRYDNPFNGVRERLYLLDFAYYFSVK